MPNDMVPKSAWSAVAHDLYADLFSPATKRVGNSLDTLAKVALSPVALLDWGYERSKDWLKEKIRLRLESTPPECIAEPSLDITISALSHIARSYDTPELRELYAELLLKAMDLRTASAVHPAYFFILEQLAPSEALVLVGLYETKKETLFEESYSVDHYRRGTKPSIEEQFKAFSMSALGRETTQASIWLTNLCRLGVLTLHTSNEAVFRPEEGDRHGIHPPSVENFEHRSLVFSEFGQAFIAACAPVAAHSSV